MELYLRRLIEKAFSEIQLLFPTYVPDAHKSFKDLTLYTLFFIIGGYTISDRAEAAEGNTIIYPAL